MARSEYLTSLTDEQRQRLEQRLHDRQTGRCFICDETIDMVLDKGQIHIDHIELPRNVKRAVKEARKGVNALAAQVKAKGDYASAESLVAERRELQSFEAEIENLLEQWKAVRRSVKGRGEAKKPTSPLWAYYQTDLEGVGRGGW